MEEEEAAAKALEEGTEDLGERVAGWDGESGENPTGEVKTVEVVLLGRVGGEASMGAPPTRTELILGAPLRGAPDMEGESDVVMLEISKLESREGKSEGEGEAREVKEEEEEEEEDRGGDVKVEEEEG